MYHRQIAFSPTLWRWPLNGVNMWEKVEALQPVGAEDGIVQFIRGWSLAPPSPTSGLMMLSTEITTYTNCSRIRPKFACFLVRLRIDIRYDVTRMSQKSLFPGVAVVTGAGGTG